MDVSGREGETWGTIVQLREKRSALGIKKCVRSYISFRRHGQMPYARRGSGGLSVDVYTLCV